MITVCPGCRERRADRALPRQQAPTPDRVYGEIYPGPHFSQAFNVLWNDRLMRAVMLEKVSEARQRASSRGELLAVLRRVLTDELALCLLDGDVSSEGELEALVTFLYFYAAEVTLDPAKSPETPGVMMEGKTG